MLLDAMILEVYTALSRKNLLVVAHLVLDGPVRTLTIFILNVEPLKRWKEHATTVFNRNTFDEVLPL